MTSHLINAPKVDSTAPSGAKARVLVLALDGTTERRALPETICEMASNDRPHAMLLPALLLHDAGSGWE